MGAGYGIRKIKGLTPESPFWREGDTGYPSAVVEHQGYNLKRFRVEVVDLPQSVTVATEKDGSTSFTGPPGECVKVKVTGYYKDGPRRSHTVSEEHTIII